MVAGSVLRGVSSSRLYWEGRGENGCQLTRFLGDKTIGGGKEKENEKGHTALEERVLLDLLGTVGPQSIFGVTTQQSRDEIPCILPHLIWELEWIIQDLPIHLGRVLYTFRVSSPSSHTTQTGKTVVEKGY